jgi:hypothetical protein
MKAPAMMLYVGDWLRNLKLRRCSPAARGVWIDIMCLLHDSEEYGVVRWPLADLVNATGAPLEVLQELVDKKVLKGSDGAHPGYVIRPKHAGALGDPVVLIEAGPGPCWYCSRQVRDAWARSRRGGETRFPAGESTRKPAKKPARKPAPPAPAPSPSRSPTARVGEGSGDGSGVQSGDGPSVASSIAYSVPKGTVAEATSSPPPAPVDPPAPPAPTKAPRPTKSPPPIPPTNAAWEAYTVGFVARYGHEPPPRNALINGQLSNLVARVGGEAAAKLAAFYLTHPNTFYVRSHHPVDVLLKDCHSLYAQMTSGKILENRLPAPAGETAYQRAMRERMAEATGGLASSQNPAAPPPPQKETFDAAIKLTGNADGTGVD